MLIQHPEQIEDVLHLFYETVKVPLSLIQADGEVAFTIPYRPLGSFAYPDASQLFAQLRLAEVSASYPAIRVLANSESYILLKLQQDDNAIGTILAGPIIQSEVTSQTIDVFLVEHKISRKRKNEALHYYAKQPVMSYRKILNAALLLYYLAYGVRLDVEHVMQRNIAQKTTKAAPEEVEAALSENRQKEFYHHSFAAQSAIFNCIRDGDVQRLRVVLNASMDGERGILHKANPLRNQKNFAICGAALATRSAIEGGLDSETAFTMSDQYIQQIEDLTDIHEVAHQHHRMLYEFAALVQQVQSSKFSPVIKQCIAFIKVHLLKGIDYKVLAQHLQMNKHYIAEMFKKETGYTIGEYIQKERIEEAKRLLLQDDYTLLDIALLLRFYDQSHFTRAFKKWCGMTPKQFQIQQGRIEK